MYGGKSVRLCVCACVSIVVVMFAFFCVSGDAQEPERQKNKNAHYIPNPMGPGTHGIPGCLSSVVQCSVVQCGLV